MSARGMFGEPMVQDPATTIRILREKQLDALRREKVALDKLDALQTMVVRALADKDAEIKRLNDVIGEMSE